MLWKKQSSEGKGGWDCCDLLITGSDRPHREEIFEYKVKGGAQVSHLEFLGFQHSRQKGKASTEVGARKTGKLEQGQTGRVLC